MSDIRIILGKKVEDILKRSISVLSTEGEWELMDIKSSKFKLSTFNQGESNPYDELCFYVRTQSTAISQTPFIWLYNYRALNFVSESTSYFINRMLTQLYMALSYLKWESTARHQITLEGFHYTLCL